MPPALNCPELLAPAGYWDCAKAAVENGADAIYFGLDRFNARMRAQNFTEADLPELMAFLHRRGVKGYVTLNTLIFPSELAEAEQYLRSMIAAGVDAAIVQDVGICRLIRHLSPDFPIHASTQMTITSAAGVQFAQELGCQLVVLARECSIKEINKIQQTVELPLEVFVHGALCVAYSGQCLTSEALGGRSANRGECAQACRMPYDLVVDGELLELGDRKYLLSPQDLAGLEVLPELVKAGVTCLKIEGRLKTPEYVANVTQIYRKALDRVMSDLEHHKVIPEDQYSLEMAFSRGLYTGWFKGINNQELVHARFGKKRGFYLGEVTEIRNEKVTVKVQDFPKPGDGIVFDSGHPEAKEEGGRIYTVESQGEHVVLSFGRDALNFRKVEVGDKVWKTSDPELDRHLRQSFNTETPQFQRSIQLEIYGEIGQNLVAIARDEQGNIIQAESTMLLVEAHNKPLTSERLEEQLGRLGNTPFYLEKLTNHITNLVMIPVSELNRLRREIVTGLEELRSRPKQWQLNPNASLLNLSPKQPENLPRSLRDAHKGSPFSSLVPLVRNFEQLKAVLQSDIPTVYCEFEDPRTYQDAVNLAHVHHQQIWVAPPRITKPGENWILQQVRDSEADGYLVRNYDQLQFFAGARCLGDFSLNVANGLTADYLKQHFNIERLTASYDLNINQLEDLITSCPPDWFEITIHQHMPMFHMEHCVFCAFMSDGTDYTNCGRPCEQHEVKLRDRTGKQHVLKADAGCRNTVFNATAQTGAEYVSQLQDLGIHHFRVEFVDESPQQVIQILHHYRQLLQGELSGAQLWRELKVQNQLGVTRGTASR